MVDSVPQISISADVDDPVSDGNGVDNSSDSTQDQSRSVLASRIRRRKKKSRSAAGGNTLAAEEEDGGVTDVETVDCDEEDDEDSGHLPSTPCEEVNAILEMIQPKIDEVNDHHDGKVFIRTAFKDEMGDRSEAGITEINVEPESDISDDDEADGAKMNMQEALTDLESLEVSANEEEGRSDAEEINAALERFELGCHTDSKEDEKVGLPRATLTLSVKSNLRKKMRKTGKRRSTAAGGSHLSVQNTDEGSLTDVEYISGGESPNLLSVAITEDEGATDVEDLEVDEEYARANGLIPDIAVHGDFTDDESARSFLSVSGANEQGITDIEDFADTDEENPIGGTCVLKLPNSDDAPVTDYEDIDVDEEDVRQPIPRNGPAANMTVHQQCIYIQEDENGTQTITKENKEMPARGFLSVQAHDEGVSDVEYLNTSADEEDAHSGVDIDAVELQDSTVQETRSSLLTAGSLAVPRPSSAALTDTEDMEVNENDVSCEEIGIVSPAA